MQSPWHDLRYAARGLRKQPAFTALAVLALALGIGAATTIYSVIQNVLFDPYPYANVERLVSVQVRDLAGARPGGRDWFPLPEFLDYEEQVTSFEEVIAGGAEDTLYTTAEGTEQLNGGLFSPNNFTFLGVPAAIGRTFTAEDTKPGTPAVFVMSHKLWVGRFGADPGLVGQSFVLNGVPTTLVGVMPPRFTKMASDLWRPVVLDRADPEPNRRFLRLQARLRPGVSLEQAEAEINVVARRLSKVYPENYPKHFTVKVVRWIDGVVGQFRQTLYTLAAAVALLLLIACGNVANMLLARATAREKEMAIRASLGASRARLVRLLLVESLFLALMGTALGWAFAHFALQAVVAAIPEGLIPREAVIRLNLPVLLFSVAAAALTALVFGLVPALQAARHDLLGPLRDSGKGTGGTFHSRALRSGLVVGEVALSLVLLAGAGLLMRSFLKLQAVDLGFDPENVLHARMPVPRGHYRTAEAKQRLLGQIVERVKTLPGVVEATPVSGWPPFGGARTEIEIPGTTPAETWSTLLQLCGEGYFRTLGVPLLRGRLLSGEDVAGARNVAVVNRMFVERYFGREDPLGRLVRFKRLAAEPGAAGVPAFEIVGVVGDVKNVGIQEPAMPEAYAPYSVTGGLERGLLVRTTGAPLAALESVRREVWAVDRGLALTMTGSMTESLKQFSYAEPRFGLTVMGLFAGVGLVLVAFGVYSVIAYTVARQTHEIGIRMALGAERADVMRMVLGMGLRLIALGVAIGLVASLGATRILSNQLWSVAPHDPVTLGAVVVVVAAAGLAACYFPARRATAVDPLEALRYE